MLVVDDTVVVRRMVTKVLEEVEGIEVVGTAATGVIALQRIEQLKPDVVTLDVEMPDMDGIETLRHLRPRWPHLPVIMFSTLTERGARATFDALSLGANDFITKPSNAASMSAALEEVTRTLVPLILEWGHRRFRQLGEAQGLITGTPAAPAAGPVVPAQPTAPSAAGSSTASAPAAATPRTSMLDRTFKPHVATTAARRIEVVTIGVSTGGPNALKEVIPALPANLRVPVLIVQHMPELFTRMLAERLDATSAIHVVEAQEGDVIEAGTVYIAPGGKHFTPLRTGAVVTAHLNEDPPENSCRPAVDVMMRGACGIWGAGVLGVVMTGMGSDGLKGCEQIVSRGGRVLIQDAPTSAVWGMPGAVADAGLAEQMCSVGELAGAIIGRVGASSVVGAR